MFNLANAESLATIISLCFAYASSATITNYLQTAYAKFIGDDTAEKAGYLTLNPLQHINTLGLFLVLLTGLGWVNTVPLNPSNVKVSRFKNLAIFLMFFIGVFIEVSLSLIALSSLVLIFGPQAFVFISNMLNTQVIPLNSFVLFHNDYSSFAIASTLILFGFVFLNIFMATCNIIVNSLRYAFTVGLENNYKYMEYADYLVIIVPIVAVILFTGPIYVYLIQFIFVMAYKIATLFGVI